MNILLISKLLLPWSIWNCSPYFIKVRLCCKQQWSPILPISTKWTIISHLNWTQKRPRHMTLNIHIKNMVVLNRLMGSQHPLLNHWIFNGNTYTLYKQIKLLYIDRFHSKRPHTITKNEWQYKHGQYNRRVNECS